MKTVSTTGLMLGMLAITVLAGTALVVGPVAYAQPSNSATATATRGDNVQSNYADVYQSQTQKCKANAESENDDSNQVGDNTNTAANDCDAYQTSVVDQTNNLTDNSVQAATARACQVLAGLGGANFGC